MCILLLLSSSVMLWFANIQISSRTLTWKYPVAGYGTAAIPPGVHRPRSDSSSYVQRVA